MNTLYRLLDSVLFSANPKDSKEESYSDNLMTVGLFVIICTSAIVSAAILVFS